MTADEDISLEEALRQDQMFRDAGAYAANLTDFITYMNKTYVFITGKFHIIREIDGAFTVMSKNDLYSSLAGKYVTLTSHDPDGSKTQEERLQAPVLFNSKLRREYIDYVFDPSKEYSLEKELNPFSRSAKFNRWRGFGTEPVKGNCDLAIKHIFDVLANGNERYAKEITQFFAHMRQKPWEKPEKCLVFVGDFGAGKSILTLIMGLILNGIKQTYHLSFQTEDLEDVFGKWNDHLEYLLLLGLDEIRWRFVPKFMGYIKGLLSNPNMRIHTRFLSTRMNVRSYIRLVITNNDDDIIPIGLHERRRFNVFYVSNRYAGKKEYFTAIFDQLKNGDAEAFMDYLLHYDISDFNPREAIVTEGLLEHKEASLVGIYKWWFDRFVSRREIFYINETYSDASVRVDKDLLRRHFNWYRRDILGIKGEVSDRKFGIQFMGMFPAVTSGKIAVKSKNGRTVSLIRSTKINGLPVYIIPSLKVCQDVLDYHLGGSYNWDNKMELENEANEYWEETDKDAYDKETARVWREDGRIQDAIKEIGTADEVVKGRNWIKIDAPSFEVAMPTNYRKIV